MNGLAHDMMLQDIRRQPDHCNFPTPCLAKEDGPCMYDGYEGACPLVKAAGRSPEAEKDAHDRLMAKYGLNLGGKK